MVLALCLSFTVQPAVHAASIAKKTTAAKKAYKKYIKNKKGYYKIVNLGGDKVPELIVSLQTSDSFGGSNKVYRFDYKSKKMKRMIKFSSSKCVCIAYYNKAKHQVCFSSAHASDLNNYFYTMKENKLVRTASYERDSRGVNGSTYLINKKNYSKSEYTKALNNAKKGFKKANSKMKKYSGIWNWNAE